MIRKILLNLHLYVGLAAALFVFVLAGTGTIMVFESELDRMLNPSLLTVTPGAASLPFAALLDSARQALPGRPILNIAVPQAPNLAAQMIVAGKQITFAYINPYTGALTGTRLREASLMVKVHQLHTNLLLGKKGEPLVGYGTLALLFLMLSGLALWWKRKLLGIKTGASRLRINFDIHNVTGFYSATVLFIVVGTGLLMAFPNALYPVVEAVTGPTELPVPDDRPASTPQPGVVRIDADSALRLAQARLPGARPTFVGLPLAPTGVYEIGFKFPEDQTPGGRSHVVLDQYSGTVLLFISSRTVPMGVRFANRIRPLHTGDIWSWPTRILFAIAAFSIVLQVVTGIIIWSVRTFRASSAAAHEMDV